MCGRYTLLTDEECRDMERIADAVDKKYRGTGVTMGRGEVQPSELAPVLFPVETRLGKASLDVEAFRWGFPKAVHSEKGSRGSGVVINARRETVREKKMFCGSFDRRRCVIPAAGFFEWKQDLDLAAGSGGAKKQKYLFQMGSGQPVYMAGIYDVFGGENRFVILTAAANRSMAEIHDRMPVILLPDQVERWLQDRAFASSVLKMEMPELEKMAAKESVQQLTLF